MSLSSEEFIRMRDMQFIDCTDPETDRLYTLYLQALEDQRNPDDTVIISFKGLLPVMAVHHNSYWPPTIHCDLAEGYDAVQCKIRDEKEVAKELSDQGMKVIDYYY